MSIRGIPNKQILSTEGEKGLGCFGLALLFTAPVVLYSAVIIHYKASIIYVLLASYLVILIFAGWLRVRLTRFKATAPILLIFVWLFLYFSLGRYSASRAVEVGKRCGDILVHAMETQAAREHGNGIKSTFPDAQATAEIKKQFRQMREPLISLNFDSWVGGFIGSFYLTIDESESANAPTKSTAVLKRRDFRLEWDWDSEKWVQK